EGIDVPQDLRIPDLDPLRRAETEEIRRAHVAEVLPSVRDADPFVRDPHRGPEMHDRLRNLRARVPRATRCCVVLSERFDVHAVHLPQGRPFEPPIQLAFLDRGLAAMPASLALIRGHRPLNGYRRRADRPAVLAERFEWNPPRRIRVAGAVLVDGRADLFRSRRQIAD